MLKIFASQAAAVKRETSQCFGSKTLSQDWRKSGGFIGFKAELGVRNEV